MTVYLQCKSFYIITHQIYHMTVFNQSQTSHWYRSSNCITFVEGPRKLNIGVSWVLL